MIMFSNKVLSGVKDDDIFVMEQEPADFWKGVHEIGSFCFYNFNINSIEVPNGVSAVGLGAFSGCKNLKNIYLPKSLRFIGSSAFENCEQLQSIEICGKVKSINPCTFKECYNLTSVILPQQCESIEISAFQNCVKLQVVFMNNKVKNISEFAFENCKMLKSIEMPKSLEKIGVMAFSGCSNLQEAILPNGVEEIENGAFQHCTNLEYVYIPKTVSYWGEHVFRGCQLPHLYVNKDKSFELSRTELKDNSDAKHYDLTNCFAVLSDFEFSGEMVSHGKEKIDEIKIYSQVCNAVINHKIKLTTSFVLKLQKAGQLDKFCNSNFKFYKQIQSLIKGGIEPDNLTGLLTFAYDIGCFSNDEGLAQRATEWLKERIIKEELQVSQFSRQFNEWQASGENREFSEFILGKSNNEDITIFQQLRQDPDFVNLFKRIHEEYCDCDSSLRPGGRFRNADGKLMFAIAHKYLDDKSEEHTKRKDRVPTVELFKEYFKNVAFSQVYNEEEVGIATELSKWSGMTQSDFVDAKRIMKEYHHNNMPANILGFHLRDISADIESYKFQTQKLAAEGLEFAKNMMQTLEFQATKEFTFDWLEKNDPMNFCLGLYCNCCATLSGVGYGIMRSNFVNPNIQNLVIKSKNGVPVAKSTAFVNRDEGYVVFNTIEVANQITDKQKDLIYEEFLLGVDAFARAYNKQNPSNPIKIMTVGMNVNKLEDQIIKTKTKTATKKGIYFDIYGAYLQDYQGDWEKKEQYKLWDIKEDGGKEHD